MAGGGESGEMNPYIAYVDLFSSVILTLLLFMLILFVNVGYYMQFNSKAVYGGRSQSNSTDIELKGNVAIPKKLLDHQVAINEERWKEKNKNTPQNIQKQQNEQMQTTQRQTVAMTETNITESKFKGGQSQGNAIMRSDKKTQASAVFNESEMVVKFSNNEIFLVGETQQKIQKKLEEIVKTHPNASIEISVGDPSKILSLTQAKQISLGRIISLKGYLNKDDKLKNRIKIVLDQEKAVKSDFGYVKFEVK